MYHRLRTQLTYLLNDGDIIVILYIAFLHNYNTLQFCDLFVADREHNTVHLRVDTLAEIPLF